MFTSLSPTSIVLSLCKLIGPEKSILSSPSVIVVVFDKLEIESVNTDLDDTDEKGSAMVPNYRIEVI